MFVTILTVKREEKGIVFLIIKSITNMNERNILKMKSNLIGQNKNNPKLIVKSKI